MSAPQEPAEIQSQLGNAGFHFLDNLLEGCQIISPDWTYLYVNAALAKHGRRSKEELIGRTMMEAYPGIENTPMFGYLRQCMEERIPCRMENEFTFPDGSKGWFELRFEPVPEGVFILSLEITDRKRAEEDLRKTEEQLRQSQKMEAIGHLAGGVAHDFNNILMVQMGYCELMHTKLRAEDPLFQDLAQISFCVERAAELTKQLLAFSHKQALQPKVFNLNAVVTDMDRMLRRLIGEDLDLVTVLADDLGYVKADAGRMEQVIMNLAVNAREAMPQGGKLTIETANVELDEEYARRHLNVIPGPHVMLAITDTGKGMDEATKSRLFEPFFTTKEKGRGTGLGLATVYGIVKQSRGNIWVYSEPGKGTAFKIYLPRVEAEPAGRPGGQAKVMGGMGELLLVVEDDQALRKLFEVMIQGLGYRVKVAANGGEALIAVEEEGLRPDLLLTDMVMPRVGGKVLAERLARFQPGLKILYMSGYTDSTNIYEGGLDPETPFLQKPFTANDLAAKIRAVLGT